jgi:hypothetical protein
VHPPRSNAAHRERNEQPLGDPADDIEQRGPRLVARGDVEEHELVRAIAVVPGGLLHRVSRIPQLLEADPFHHPTVRNVETGD